MRSSPLKEAILPLLKLADGHVLATLSAVVLALYEGRTGIAVSGVFGAGKARSAAVLLAGLLVFDPSLQLMVFTKENVAAHAVAEHLVALRLPEHIQQRMGRLVGYYEQNRKGSSTHWAFFLQTGISTSDKSHSSLVVEVGSNKNVDSPTVLLWNGWGRLTLYLKMKVSSTVTWRRRLLLQERLLPALRLGLVITVKRQED